MKRLTYMYFILYFSIAGIIMNIDMHELQKINNLIEHFKEHSVEHPELTFVDLLNMHYGSDAKEEIADEHNDKLPFQSQHCCHTVAFYVLNITNYPDFKIFPKDIKVKSVYNRSLPSTPAGSIWQPPKFFS